MAPPADAVVATDSASGDADCDNGELGTPRRMMSGTYLHRGWQGPTMPPGGEGGAAPPGAVRRGPLGAAQGTIKVAGGDDWNQERYAV